MPRLLLATNNAGKVRELRDLLGDCGWQLVTPAEVGVSLDVDETGATYVENATLKARAFATASGLPAVADDSGLEVDALGSQPGPLHHLLGYDGVDHADRLAILHRRLASTPPAQWSCRYRAVIVVVFPDGATIEADGSCEGLIVPTEAGSNGFGYDPIFYVPDAGKTMAELTPAEKNAISHRAVAARAICPKLRAAASTAAETL